MGKGKALKLLLKGKKALKAGKGAKRAAKTAKNAKRAARAAKGAKKTARAAKGASKVAKKGSRLGRGLNAIKRGGAKLAKLSPLAMLGGLMGGGGAGGAGGALGAVGNALSGVSSAARSIGKIAKTGRALFKATNNALKGDFADAESFVMSKISGPTTNTAVNLTSTTNISDNSTEKEILLDISKTLHGQSQIQSSLLSSTGTLSEQNAQLAEGQGKISTAVIESAKSTNTSLEGVGETVSGVTEGINGLQEAIAPTFTSDSFGGAAGGILGAIAGGGGGSLLSGILSSIGSVATAAIAGIAGAGMAAYEYLAGGDDEEGGGQGGGDYYEGDTYEGDIYEGDEYEGDTIVDGDDVGPETPQEEDEEIEQESDTDKLMDVAFAALDPVGEMLGDDNIVSQAGGAAGGFLGKNVAALFGGDEEKGEMYGEVAGNLAAGIGATAAVTAGLSAVTGIAAAPLTAALGAAYGGAKLGEYLRGTDTMVGRGLNEFDQQFASLFGLSDEQIKADTEKKNEETRQAIEAHSAGVADEQRQKAQTLTSNGMSGPISDLSSKIKDFTKNPENAQLVDEQGYISSDIEGTDAEKYVQSVSLPFQQLVIALAGSDSPVEQKEEDVKQLEEIMRIAGTQDYSKRLMQNRLRWLTNFQFGKQTNDPNIKAFGLATVGRLAKALDEAPTPEPPQSEQATIEAQPSESLTPEDQQVEVVSTETSTPVSETPSTQIVPEIEMGQSASTANATESITIDSTSTPMEAPPQNMEGTVVETPATSTEQTIINVPSEVSQEETPISTTEAEDIQENKTYKLNVSDMDVDNMSASNFDGIESIVPDILPSDSNAVSVESSQQLDVNGTVAEAQLSQPETINGVSDQTVNNTSNINTESSMVSTISPPNSNVAELTDTELSQSDEQQPQLIELPDENSISVANSIIEKIQNDPSSYSDVLDDNGLVKKTQEDTEQAKDVSALRESIYSNVLALSSDSNIEKEIKDARISELMDVSKKAGENEITKQIVSASIDKATERIPEQNIENIEYVNDIKNVIDSVSEQEPKEGAESASTTRETMEAIKQNHESVASLTNIVPEQNNLSSFIQDKTSLMGDANGIYSINSTPGTDDKDHDENKELLNSLFMSSEDSNVSLKTLVTMLKKVVDVLTQPQQPAIKPRENFVLDGGYVT